MIYEQHAYGVSGYLSLIKKIGKQQPRFTSNYNKGRLITPLPRLYISFDFSQFV